MKIFTKREKVIQNITFISIMSAINCVLLLLTSFIPYLMIMLTFALPFASLIVTITCKKRFYPIYIIVTIALCLLVSMDSISSVIFYIIPSLFSGFIFGICLEKGIPSSYSILYSGFIYVICSYINLLVCEFLLDQPIQNLYFTLLNLSSFSYRNYIISLFIFSIGIIQSSLSYLFIQKAIKNIGLKEVQISDGDFYLYLLFFILLTILSTFLKPEAYLMFVGFSVYAFIQADYVLYKNSKKLFVIANACGIISAILTFAIFYKTIESCFSICLLLPAIFIVGIIGYINNCFVKRIQK